MKPLRLIIIPAVLIFVAGIFYWALYTPKEDVSQRIYRTLKEQEKRADLSFKNVTFEEVASGEKFWQLEAEAAVVNKSTGIAALQKTRGVFYKKGKPALKFHSPAALWDMKKKEIFLDRPLGYDANYERRISTLVKTLGANPLSIFNLSATYKKGLGYWFQANNLSWRLADEQLFCTGGIILNKGEVTGYAKTLKGDVGFNKIELGGNPRIAVSLPKSLPVTLEALTFEFTSAQDLFVARGNPRVTWQDATIYAETARYFQIKRKLELDRKVIINYRDISAWGDFADYFISEQKIILSGSARAQQGGSKLSGDKIVVSLKDQKISLSGKGKVVITEEKIPK